VLQSLIISREQGTEPKLHYKVKCRRQEIRFPHPKHVVLCFPQMDPPGRLQHRTGDDSRLSLSDPSCAGESEDLLSNKKVNEKKEQRKITITESQNTLGWKGPPKINLVQLPCHQHGHLQLDQVAQSPIQPGLECFQGWGIDHLSGQPVPGFHHSHCEKFLPYIQSKSTLV